jgi:hypothetical protein
MCRQIGPGDWKRTHFFGDGVEKLNPRLSPSPATGKNRECLIFQRMERVGYREFTSFIGLIGYSCRFV